jgi:hypothetical protein
MSHEIEHKTTFLSMRLPPRLAHDLRQVAEREANTASSVARRLIATGLSRELRADECKPSEAESR